MKENVHFIDCGANVGMAIDWAVKKYSRPDSPRKLARVDAFEPEIILLAKYSLDRMKIEGLHIHSEAAWKKNEIKKFFVQFWGTRTGSSLMEDKEQCIKKGQIIPSEYLGNGLTHTYNHPDAHCYIDKDGNTRSRADMTYKYDGAGAHAQCIDIAEWIFKNVSKENYNVLKIDIEGAEYPVIDHLLKTGAHEYIDEWLVEFTGRKKTPDSYDQAVIDRFMATNPNYVDWDSKEMIERWHNGTL